MFRAFADLTYGSPRYQIGDFSVDQKELISEGGYAYVYRAVETTTSQEFALKKILCQNQERLDFAQREVQVMQTLPSHPNIVRFYGASSVTENNTQVVLILMELCKGGTLINLLERYEGQLNLEQVLFCLKEICQGIQVVHQAGYVHRDLKVENVLVENKKFKLCDFGSCTNEHLDLASASRKDLLFHEETFERQTTLMYRPPEMIDLYTRHTIGPKVDVWMLGCIAYTLAYFKHPFQDQSSLAIVNAHYTFPSDSRFNQKFKNFVAWILNPDPSERPLLGQVIESINNYHSIQDFQVKTNRHKPQEKKSSKDRDLTEEEIQAEMRRVREGMQRNLHGEFVGVSKKKQPVSIWSVPGSQQQDSDLLDFNNSGWANF